MELLRADLLERGRYASSALDVGRGAWMARLAAAGVGGGRPCTTSPGAAALATAGCAVALFLAFGMAMWSQLTIGWQWAAPDGPAVAASVEVMSVALLVLVPLGLAAAAPLVWWTLRALVSGRSERLRGPVSAFTLGALALALGTVHFSHGWPGTGGHPWSERGLVPGGLASLAWSATRPITAYWAHPTRLETFPAAQLGWMALAPLAMGSMLAGATTAIRRLSLPRRLLRWEARVARVGAVVLLAFLGAGICRVLASDPGPRHLFTRGSIDILDVIGMGGSLLVAVLGGRKIRESCA